MCLTNNFICYITRTGDYDLSKENSKNHKNEDLKKRSEYINTLNEHIEESHNFEIDNSRTLIYGICSSCNERNV